MSTAEAGVAVTSGGGALAREGAGRGGVRAWWRLLRSELSLAFRRWRNLALLAVVAALPVLLGIALRLAAPGGGGGGPGGGEGPGGGPGAFLFQQLAENGIFLAFIALTIMLTLVLPLVVAVVSGESVAGEANSGTLRYLLAVPAGRSRLLSVKYTVVVFFGLVACLVAAGAALLTGLALFPVGNVTLLSGATVPMSDGLLRLLLIVLYLTAALAALGAIGLAISTLTEHPIAAITAVMIVTVASEVADNVPQFAPVQPYLPTHWWLSFDGLLRAPIDTGVVLHGLLSFGVYAVIFASIAWARFTSADVTS
jgi:ABC-2 type transport system permease protein